MFNFTPVVRYTRRLLVAGRATQAGIWLALLLAGANAALATAAPDRRAPAATHAVLPVPPGRTAAKAGAQRVLAVPTITGFAPAAGLVGATVTITGTDFTGLTRVAFNGVAAASTYTSTQITAAVPVGATTGVISVTGTGGTGNSATAFTVLGGTDYLMSSAALTTCSGTLYDSGGAAGNYGNNESFVKVISPGTTGAKVQLTFLSFSTEAGYDFLRIYDGPSSSSPLLGSYSGTTSPGTVTASSTNSTGQLTVVFASDAVVTAAGFAATIACVTSTGTTFAVTGRSPASNTVAATTTAVGVTFNAVPTAASAANIRVLANQAGGQRTLGTAVVSGTTATLPVTGNAFRPGETVQVTVPATVLSTAGVAVEPYTYQFTAATTASSGRIGASLATYAVSGQQNDMNLGDVTGDGLPDAVVANSSDNLVVVLPGQSNGTFGTGVSYPGGGSPWTVIFGDVNNDGRLDVVTGNTLTSVVTIMLGTTSGTLGAPINYPTQTIATAPALADFNRDGWLDLVACNGGTTAAPGTSVSVFLNNGNGTFGARTNYPTGTTPQTAVAGDVNGDGRFDLITNNLSANTVSVLLGTGTGSFSAKTDYAVGSAPFLMTLGDLDNDADLDIITCNQLGNSVSILRGTGSGTFTNRLDYPTGTSPQDVDLGDMNGDGRLDIITANRASNTVSILLNSAASTFTTTAYAAANGPVSTALADLNGDGRLDLATLNTITNTVSVFLGLPAPTIASFTPASGPVGTSVTLTGTFLTGATQLLLNGVAISGFVVNAAGTAITGTIPAGATSGVFSVTTPAGTATSPTAFTVTAPQLAVTQGSTAYASGSTYAYGNVVLNTTASATFTLTNAGAAPLTLTSTSTTGNFALSGPVPTSVAAGDSAPVSVSFTPTALGSQGGSLRLTSSLGTYVVSLTGTGIYPVPTSSGLQPASGPVGTIVIVTGTGFTSSGTTVTLNGVALTGVVVSNNGTTLTFSIPADATAGPVVVTTPGGTVTAGAFCVQYIPAGSNVSRCGVDSVTLAASGAPTGGSYAWYAQATGGTAIAGATGASYTTPSLSATTTYYVAIGTGAGNTACEGPRQAITATINALPSVTVTTSGPTALCAGGSVTLTASGADSYQWSTGQATASITVSAAGSYSVTGQSAAGCTATSAATTVTVTPLPTAPATTPASRCGAGSVTLTASGAPTDGSYAWYAQATGGTALAGATGASYTTPNLSATTTYYVSALTALGCEGPRTAVAALINAVPTVSVAASGPLTFCAGGSVTLTASGADSYQWSTGQTTASITVSASGSYSVTATNTSGCSAVAPATAVTVSPAPAQPTITQSPAGVLISSSTTGNQWYLNGTAIAGATGPSYVVATAAQLGNYTLVVTSAAGCSSSASAALLVTVMGTTAAVPTTEIHLYPNPAHRSCTLEIPALAGARTGSLALLNALGQVVQARSLAMPATGSQTQLDLQGLAAGVYLVRLQVGSTLLTKKLVIE